MLNQLRTAGATVPAGNYSVDKAALRQIRQATPDGEYHGE